MLAAPVRKNENMDGMDFLQDALASGRKLPHRMSIEDAYTREMLAIEVDTSLPALRVVRVLDQSCNGTTSRACQYGLSLITARSSLRRLWKPVGI